MIAPHSLGGTRFEAEASLWTRWRVNSIALEITPSAGSMTSGAYLVGWTPDPTYDVRGGLSAITTVNAMKPAFQAHISQPMRFVVPADMLQRWYIVGDDAHGDTQNHHGRVYIILASPLGNVTSDSNVSLLVRINWSVQFEGPVIPVAAERVAIYAEDDYTPYFTTSTGDWNEGKTLSVKANSGGALVPFNGVESGKLYEIDPSAKLYYSTGRTPANGLIKFGVRIINYPGQPNAMAVFAGRDYALKYLATGDMAYCTPYVSAAAYVVPNNPAWNEGSLSLEEVKFARELHHLTRQLKKGARIRDVDEIGQEVEPVSRLGVEPSAPPLVEDGATAPVVSPLYPDLQGFYPGQVFRR